MLEATDVNDDGLTTALDALTVINHLNSGAEGKLSLDAVSTGAKLDFTDVNNDGTVSPLDALLVINQLNQLSQGISPTEDAADTIFGDLGQAPEGEMSHAVYFFAGH